MLAMPSRATNTRTGDLMLHLSFIFQHFRARTGVPVSALRRRVTLGYRLVFLRAKARQKHRFNR